MAPLSRAGVGVSRSRPSVREVPGTLRLPTGSRVACQFDPVGGWGPCSTVQSGPPQPSEGNQQPPGRPGNCSVSRAGAGGGPGRQNNGGERSFRNPPEKKAPEDRKNCGS